MAGVVGAVPVVSVPSSSGNSLQRRARQAKHHHVAVSVPSSSGNSLQRSLTTMAANVLTGFSPLFIGELSSTGSTGARGSLWNEFQSPLHRGTLFNPGEWRLVSGHVHVSVPSSSGNSLQRSGAFWLWRHSGVSVPSSSGNSLQPPTAASNPLKLGFQSPLHRGTLFNRRWRQGRKERCGFQSPLHRGTLFNPACGGPGLARVQFQSPLHRGTLFNKAEEEDRKKLARCFSPLFIGELSSTVASHQLRVRELMFQSPLHRGTLFNCSGLPRACTARSVSVPSSSGNSLQPGGRPSKPSRE